ncbi:ArsJ-associated glyceraldehyde-3-phosphate dehydrogenase [Magnetofaba australis]|uniref:Glyceraldehyde-3-phosphate dehydrogenase n=1 Tax=Magnetofaba australis IT-1 TaxID=1434232 RepID=A0A1Y2K8K2_9PROT|nr:ArsJ-associated glyceraldehyde-3-phosphate dehydrogenase [Magnetofaba australis]OSM05125.1 putative glyceraldehyde-3-phosphate dehydrogenase [Magnetofaba australis IT-1]
MTIRIGINGFGRMGRLALRAAWDWPEFSVTHINDPGADAACSAHLLAFDSVQGPWRRDVRSNDSESFSIDGAPISYSQSRNPHAVDWAGKGVDLVLEASGKFKTPETLNPYLDNGARKVLVAAPVKQGALNLVMGINHTLYNPAEHHIVTAASCTTNCLAPVVKVIHEGLGIRHGAITTIHDITNTQTIVDKGHKDLRRARACGQSLIPTSTGSATAITQIFPELTGRLNGLAVRVPLLNASLTDCVFEVERPTTVEEVNGLLKQAAEGPLRGILGYETRPLVSVDFKGDPRSSIIDALSTLVINETQVKILAWYDNEWGYVNRMMEIARMIALGLAE